MPLVSIIVPVYKAEKWLHRCVDSILAQTMADFELLLIDDGSPDKSGEICDEYAAKDSRVRVFHKENGGVSSARNLGLDNTTGEWITFVDSDDMLPKNALENYISLISPSVNIICGEFVRFRELILEERLPKKQVKKQSYEEYRKNIFIGKYPSLCGKLIKKYLFDDTIFNVSQSIKMGEDTIASLRLAFMNSFDVIFTNQCVYYYRQHRESCMHTFVASPEYEEMFTDCLFASVPEKYQDEYRAHLIERNIKTLDYFCGYSVDVLLWRNSSFYNNLLHDIEKYKFKGLFIERLLLTIVNPQLRKVLILLKRIKNKVLC